MLTFYWNGTCSNPLWSFTVSCLQPFVSTSSSLLTKIANVQYRLWKCEKPPSVCRGGFKKNRLIIISVDVWLYCTWFTDWIFFPSLEKILIPWPWLSDKRGETLLTISGTHCAFPSSLSLPLCCAAHLMVSLRAFPNFLCVPSLYHCDPRRLDPILSALQIPRSLMSLSYCARVFEEVRGLQRSGAVVRRRWLDCIEGGTLLSWRSCWGWGCVAEYIYVCIADCCRALR